MYLKKILINGYLHFQSHHQSLVKTVVISCLRKRPERVYMDAPSMELQHLFNVRTGVLSRHVHRRMNSRCCCYHTSKGLVKICLVCHPLNVKTVLKSFTALSTLLAHI